MDADEAYFDQTFAYTDDEAMMNAAAPSLVYCTDVNVSNAQQKADEK